MRVLHISSGNLYGGVEVLLATLARERGCCPDMEPHFALCFEGRLSEELTILGATATLLGSVQTRFPWKVWLARRRLAALLHRKSFDVVVCHMSWAHAIFGPVARKAKIPLVFWMHDVAQGKHWIELWAARCRPDFVICNSLFTAGSVSRIFSAKPALPSKVVYCPVSPQIRLLAPEELNSIRASLNTPSDACVIIQVGRMEPYKGHALHLDALARLADVPNWVCWIVGGAQRAREQTYLTSLQRRAEALGIGTRIRFTGGRSDARALLGAADLFCQPNLDPEPFGIVFIEALYANLPIICTAQGGALEIVDQSCGRLVPLNSPELLADTLRSFVTDRDLRHSFAQSGYKRACQLCAPPVVLAELSKIFAHLLPSS